MVRVDTQSDRQASAAFLTRRLNRSSLKSQRAFNQSYVTQLKVLLETTAHASSEIKKFLIDAEVASKRLEALIKSGNTTLAEQVRVLTIIEDKSTETYETVKDLSRWHKSYSQGVKDALDNAQTHIVKLFSLKQYMEEWADKLIQYCKEIITMVRRNTEILLSLHGMLAKFELLVSRSKVDLPSIVFENVFGIKMVLPYQLCNTWEAGISSHNDFHFSSGPTMLTPCFRHSLDCSAACSSTSQV